MKSLGIAMVSCVDLAYKNEPIDLALSLSIFPSMKLHLKFYFLLFKNFKKIDV